MSLKSVIKKIAKAGTNPNSLIGAAFGLPGAGLARGLIRDERRERIQEQRASAEREKALLEKQTLEAEEERRRKKEQSLGQRVTGLASLIGGNGETLG